MKKLILLIFSLSCIYLHAEFIKVESKDFLEIRDRLEVIRTSIHEDVVNCEFPRRIKRYNYDKLYIQILFVIRGYQLEAQQEKRDCCYFSFDSKDLTKENFLKHIGKVEEIHSIVWYGLNKQEISEGKK